MRGPGPRLPTAQTLSPSSSPACRAGSEGHAPCPSKSFPSSKVCVTLPQVPLKSRFGRRLLLLFVGCALVPIAVVAGLSYAHVTRELRVQSQRRLDQTSKALGLALYERFLLLDATLKIIPPRALAQLVSHPPAQAEETAHAALGLGGAAVRPRARTPDEREASRLLAAGLDLLARERFEALEFVADDGRRMPVFGHLREPPVLSRDQEQDLRLGLPLVVNLHPQGPVSRTLMLRRVDQGEGPRGTLVGLVSARFLWATIDASMPTPWTTLSVVDDSGHTIFSSTATSVIAAYDPLGEVPPEIVESLPGQTVDSTAPPLVTASWSIPLDEVFAAPRWTLVLGESRDQVFGPMVRFSGMFVWVVLLSGVVVLAVGTRQIRRSIVPLAALQQGTRRIAQRDFTSRVTVSSRDEFEELAGSFNAMAVQLDRQFQALSTAAEIDRAVLSATDAAAIVETLVARMPDVFPCHLLSITIMAPDGTKSLNGMVYDYDDASRHHARVELHAADVQDLLQGSEVVLHDRVTDVPAYLAPLTRLSPRSVVVLPLRFRRQLVGVLALGDRNQTPPPLLDHLQVRRLADQVAVALANARMIEQVRTLAYYDSLTGLPNRLSYKDRLARALIHARERSTRVAALFIDLDHFSRINDTLGHEAGDQLLQHVAHRLHACCREREDEVGPAHAAIAPDVARLGGDEFTVIMPGLGDPHDATKLARRILSALAHPIRIGDQEIFVNASIGIAIFPEDGENLETLLMHADTAMYQAKEQGGSSYQVYAHAMNASSLQRLTLESALRRAVERSEFVLHYQPIVAARTNQIVGAEALVRWRHPELGLLLPSEFVPLAEENGLIGPLGEWVLRTACLQNRDWQVAGLPPIRVVVNLSSRQLDGNLAEQVAHALQATGLEPRFLGLELTESVLAAHQQEVGATLHALRAMGLHLAVDDFGTGFSSFGYLKHFPLDALKIDRSFVREIATSPDDAAITTAIIAMAHALGLKTVGEGVETDAQQVVLRRQGCDELQGYLFSRAVSAEEFAELLARQSIASKTRRLRSA
jgi:diguanylate cyclase (GGDEF)-like protein